jgi:hypothetical protein
MIRNQKLGNILKAVVVVTVVLAFIMPSTAVLTNNNQQIAQTQEIQTPYNIYTTERNAVKIPIPRMTTQGLLDDDILISALNPTEDDMYPKVAVNSQGDIAIIYEQINDVLSTTVPIVVSGDAGATWVMQFEFDSIDFSEGSGVLSSPDIKYNPTTDEFFWHAIDQLATMYNEESAWIPGDIVNAESATWWGISGQDSTDYTDGAVTYIGQWFLGYALSDNYDIDDCPGIGYYWYDAETETIYFPNEVDAGWAAGYYYDGQSVLATAPALKPELATGDNRVFMVMETTDETNGNKISMKYTYNDLDPESDTFLFTSGGGPGGMDKFADIEVWPWQEFVAENGATDPDVSASGTNAAVVYSLDNDVFCYYTTDDGETWGTSTVAEDAGYAAIHVVGNTAYCVYVKDGNLYLDTSEDGGATWLGSPIQINDVDGTVIATAGTADISKGGIVWMDSRNGADDIYWNRFLSLSPDIPILTGPNQVKVNEEAEFCATSADPQGDDVYYLFSWGDGTDSDWVGPFSSGEEGCTTHAWDAQGDYEVKVKAKDDAGHESEWSPSMPITVPRMRNNVQISSWFIELLRTYFPGIYNQLQGVF